MSVALTSLQNYRQHRDEGRISAQCMEILRYVDDKPGKDFSRAEISEALDMRLSSVCGRVNELLKDGYLESTPHTRHCQVTGKTVHPVRARPLF